MKFKHVAVLVACVVFAMALSGCGGSNQASTSSTEETYADELFVADLGRALEARWEITDNPDNASLTEAEEKEMLDKAIQAELDILEGYTSQKFEDSTLQEQAIKYINCLKDQQAALEYKTVDYTKYSEDWGKAYDTRTQLLKGFADNYGLTVSEANEATLKELLTNGSLVDDKEKKQKAVEKICKKMKFKATDESYQYEAVVENTAGFDFKTFSVYVNLLDKDGVIVESTYADVNNWEAGQKAKFEFWFDGDFDKISVKSNYWEAA